MAEVKREHRVAADAAWYASNDPADSNFGPEAIAQALADLEATVEARVRRELGLTTAEGYAIAPPETLAEAWDDGYKVGKCDGTCDAKGYARRIGDKNPHRDAVEQALSVPEPAASEREGLAVPDVTLAAWAQSVLDESAARHAKLTGKEGSYEMTVAPTKSGELSWAVDVPGFDIVADVNPGAARIAAARMLLADDPTLPALPPQEAGKAQAEGWTRVDDKLPVYLDGWWWVQFSSGEISTVPYIRALNQWLFEGKSRDHGTIVAYCRAAAPPMGEVFHPGPLPSPPSEPSQLPAGEAGR